MLLSQLGTLDQQPECLPLRSSHIWGMEIADISLPQLIVAHKRIWISSGKASADRCMSVLIREAETAFSRGKIPPVPLLKYKIPADILSYSDVLEVIKRFSLVDRQMIVYALFEGMTLRDAALLCWTEIVNKPHHHLTARILRFRPRHIFSDLVFWVESANGRPTMVANAEGRFLDKTGCTWSQFVEAAKNAIIDVDVDKDELSRAFARIDQNFSDSQK